MSEYKVKLPETTFNKIMQEYRDKTEMNRREKLDEIEREKQEAMKRSPGNKYIEELYEHDKNWWNKLFDKQLSSGINLFESNWEKIKEIPQQKPEITIALAPVIQKIQKEEVSVEATPKLLSPKEHAENIQLMMNTSTADIVRFQLIFLAADIKDNYGNEGMAKLLMEAYDKTEDVLSYKSFRDPENAPYANKVITVLNRIIAHQDWRASHVKA